MILSRTHRVGVRRQPGRQCGRTAKAQAGGYWILPPGLLRWRSWA